ncbi:hypothetical protein O181_032782 [Austropuccinia psidii MF-1]|uniref:Phosphatidate cytidylyltransferase, mitochondrial n=1 Tax=Austropuccinia psidii MF-1 TaxID=1389203 RepID=A0A9Q3D399_9BASI|nr:hypothetical protein [Austropuccinia psidii MF-1]
MEDSWRIRDLSDDDAKLSMEQILIDSSVSIKNHLFCPSLLSSLSPSPASLESLSVLIPVSSDLKGQLESIIQSFKSPIRYAIAYGSGVFTQKSYSSQQTPMLDFIFAVSHPNHWHSLNLYHHPHHYSLPSRLIGSSAISWLQERGPGAGIWYNVESKINDRIIKYGIVSIDTLCNDLLDWNTLYLAGRMHKPTYILQDNARIRLAQQVNLASALRTALLFLPERFDEVELYCTIAGLSYIGDFRMRWGENPKKVDNIVWAQLEHFRILYEPLISSLRNHLQTVKQSPDLGQQAFYQDRSPQALAELLKKLPIRLKDKTLKNFDCHRNFNTVKVEDLDDQGKADTTNEMEHLLTIAEDSMFENFLRSALIEIIKKPSLNQSIKGILSAGPLKSFRYVIPKIKKRWNI